MDFPIPRLFHCLPAGRANPRGLSGIASEPMLAVAQAEVSVQMLTHGDRASGQGAAPADRLDLQAAVFKLHRVVAVDDPFVVQRKGLVEVLRRERQEGGSRLPGGHLEAAVELGDIGPIEKAVGRLDALDITQPEFLRQPSLPGGKAALRASPRLRRVGRD